MHLHCFRMSSVMSSSLASNNKRKLLNNKWKMLFLPNFASHGRQVIQTTESPTFPQNYLPSGSLRRCDTSPLLSERKAVTLEAAFLKRTHLSLLQIKHLSELEPMASLLHLLVARA